MHLRRVLNAAVLAAGLTNTLVSASYFSSGWSPDGVSTAAAASPTPPLTGSGPGVKATTSPSGGFDWTVLVTQGPIGDLFRLAGINVTERMELAKKTAAESPFDPRIPLITDENYDSLVRAPTDPNVDDTWFIVITMGTTKEPVSKYVDEAFDKAYNISIDKKDVHHVKWGRIDYMTVTQITTEWMVWKAPMLVVVRDQGKELRFLAPSQISLEPENLYKFVKTKGWNEVPAWTGAFAPGGSLEKYVKVYANLSKSVYSVINVIPKWLFLIASGSIASIVIQFMHNRGKPATAGASTGSATRAAAEEKKPEVRPKRYVVKKATDVHPELSGSMTASMMSESDNPDGTKKPSMGPRRSTRNAKK